MNAKNFTTVLQTLGLTQGLYKPSPLSNGPSIQSSVQGNLPSTRVTSSDTQSTYDPLTPGTSPGVNNGTTGDPCFWQAYDPQPLGAQAYAQFDQAKANIYRYRQQQSVNLGSWFVHEQWMTPSLFTCAAGDQVSEIDIANGWGSTMGARAVLERHWDTFINQSDFQYLASIGINTVRLPIGYWDLGPDFCQGTPYQNVSYVYQNSWPRIQRAVNWAAASGLGVLIDLHGAPGSQNGQQHSGISDGYTNLFDNPTYVNQTMNVLAFLTEEFTYVTNVVGIQILNEPQNVPGLEDFYTQAISTMRQVFPQASTFPLYLHDGFDLQRFSTYVSARHDFVVQDHHSYFVFTTEDDEESASNHTSDIEGGLADSLRAASDAQRRNLVVDEFSCALSDDSLKNETDPEQARRDFCTGQLDVYANATAGWSFWAYRKEQCEEDPGWCFTNAVGRYLPATFFSYGTRPTPEPLQIPSVSTILQGIIAPPSDPSSAFVPASIDPGSPPALPPAFGGGFRRRTYSRKVDRSRRLRRQDSSYSAGQQRSTNKGYSDGYYTARIFGAYGSKLGFVGQYIADSIASLGPSVVMPGTEDNYKSGFMQGVAKGEAEVAASAS